MTVSSHRTRPWILFSTSLCALVFSSCQYTFSSFWHQAMGGNLQADLTTTLILFFALGVSSVPTDKSNSRMASLIIWAGLVWNALIIPIVTLALGESVSTWLLPHLFAALNGLLWGQGTASLRLIGKKHGVSTAEIGIFASAGMMLAHVVIPLLLAHRGFEQGSLIASGIILGLLIISLSKTFFPKYPRWRFSAGLAFSALALSSYPLYQQFFPNSSIASQNGLNVLVEKRSPKQKIVFLEENRGKSSTGIRHKLFTGGLLRFESSSEQGNHACLINVPLEASRSVGFRPKSTLILGAGDGLAARNLAGLSHVDSIQVVESDPVLLDVVKDTLKIRMYNLDSLSHKKVNLEVHAPYQWLKESREQFDFIISAFPPPSRVGDLRYFSAEFFALALSHLSPKGSLVIRTGQARTKNQTLSPLFSEVQSALLKLGTESYVYENSSTHESFVVLTKNPELSFPHFFAEKKMVHGSKHPHACQHHPAWQFLQARTNTLNTIRPKLAFPSMQQFDYSGYRKVLLPQ